MVLPATGSFVNSSGDRESLGFPGLVSTLTVYCEEDVSSLVSVAYSFFTGFSHEILNMRINYGILLSSLGFCFSKTAF